MATPRFSRILIPLIGLLLACGAAGTRMEKQNAPDSFERVGELKPERFGLTAAAQGHEVYLVGGSEFQSVHYGGLLGMIQKYDAVDGSLVTLDTKIIPRRYHVAEIDKGRLYILGGVTADRAVGDVRLIETDKVEIVDLATGEVTMGAPLPRTRMQAASMLYQGKIYVIGGQKQGGNHPLNCVDIYDIENDRWTRGASLPVARTCDAVLHGDKIYAVGGFNGFSLRRIDVYDPVTDHWQKLADAPTALSAHRCCVVDDKLYTLGDYRQLNLVLQYDFTTGRWTQIEGDFLGRRHHAIARDGRQVYIFGGVVGTEPGLPLGGVRAIQRFTPMDGAKSVQASL